MALIADSLTFGYGCETPLYRDFSLEVEAGERVALVGPSGAGKTTLCRLLAGYLAPQGGGVVVDGRDLSLHKKGPRPVQLIWQHPEQSFDPRLRMRTSLAEGGFDALSKSSQELARAFKINDEWLDRYPGELSGGELMRLCLVRALSACPRYLICDEISAMLDVVTQAHIWHELICISKARNMGLVVVSHSPALLERIATRQIDPYTGCRQV